MDFPSPATAGYWRQPERIDGERPLGAHSHLKQRLSLALACLEFAAINQSSLQRAALGEK